MTLASEIWTWQEGDRVFSRLTTNVRQEKLIARLRALGMLELIESVHAYFGDRAYGGSGYEVFWKDHVRLEDLPRLVDI